MSAIMGHPVHLSLLTTIVVLVSEETIDNLLIWLFSYILHADNSFSRQTSHAQHNKIITIENEYWNELSFLK